MNALDVLCAQLTRDLFAIAKFLFSGEEAYKTLVLAPAAGSINFSVA